MVDTIDIKNVKELVDVDVARHVGLPTKPNKLTAVRKNALRCCPQENGAFWSARKIQLEVTLAQSPVGPAVRRTPPKM